MEHLKIAPTQLADKAQLLTLYQAVAIKSEGLIRIPSEIDEAYIDSFMNQAHRQGLSLAAYLHNKVVGEIHAHTPRLFAFQHLLTDLTVAVNPDYQGKGIGRKLFTNFLDTVTQKMPHIVRVELYTRAHHQKNIDFYKSLGFQIEGRHMDKIYKTATAFETPLSMAWRSPSHS
ncbi:MAG: GNAT family N-acetyltransferase [Bacteroidota bacterium]